MSESNLDLRLEIAHVLFIDIVGYSKLLINEQHEMLQKLNQIVRGTEAFKSAEAAGKLIRFPSGGRNGTRFFNHARCASAMRIANQQSITESSGA
jgi:hypothetical protein